MALKSEDSTASIDAFEMVIEREFRRIRVQDGTNNHVEITEAGTPYSFLTNAFNEIVDYSGLVVIDDTIGDVRLPYIDVATVNAQQGRKFNILINVRDKDGNAVTGKVAGFITVK